jgi:cytochrome oxidase Cu insertion factor (SCO1/SenC/PrrC family)
MAQPRIRLTPEAFCLSRSTSAASQAYRVYFRKVPLPGGDYTIEHASFTYLMDRDGRYVGFFPPGTNAERMLEIIRPQLQTR